MRIYTFIFFYSQSLFPPAISSFVIYAFLNSTPMSIQKEKKKSLSWIQPCARARLRTIQRCSHASRALHDRYILHTYVATSRADRPLRARGPWHSFYFLEGTSTDHVGFGNSVRRVRADRRSVVSGHGRFKVVTCRCGGT